MHHQPDYIVIGGGHNGLTAACYLARAGKSVLVLEQRAVAGGMSISEPLVAAAPHHRLSPGAIDTVFIRGTPILQELNLATHGLQLFEVDPGYGWINGDNDTLMLFSDPAKTAQDIARFSPSDGRKYLELANIFQRIIRLQQGFSNRPLNQTGLRHFIQTAFQLCADRSLRKTLLSLLSVTAFEAISENFESEALQGLYAYWCAIACPLDAPNSGIFLASFSQIHQLGCTRPRGGMSSLVLALSSCLQSLGGEIRTNSAVSRINVNGGKATGVTLRDGVTLSANVGIIAACAPQLTYGSLLGDHCPEKIRQKLPHIPANSNNSGPFKIDMAMSSSTALNKAIKRRAKFDDADIGGASLMTGSLQDHIDNNCSIRRGECGKNPPIWMTVLSHSDPTLCPPDQSVLYLYSTAPVHSPTPRRSLRNIASTSLLSKAAQFIDGLESEIGRSVLMPEDFEQDYGAPNGCIYHVDMLPSRLGGARPARGMAGPGSDIDGLYLASAGEHPGGGVYGLPGKFAAQAALQKQ